MYTIGSRESVLVSKEPLRARFRAGPKNNSTQFFGTLGAFRVGGCICFGIRIGLLRWFPMLFPVV